MARGDGSTSFDDLEFNDLERVPLPFEGVADPPAHALNEPLDEAAGAAPGTDAGPSVYGVGQVAHYLGELLATDPFLRDVWVSGEVTNLSRSQAGHVFFTLRAGAGALRCAFFRQYNLGVAVDPGELVLVHGRVSLYADRGEVQLYVDALQPEGAGVLQAEFRRLYERLKAEGLFDPGRKRSLPRYPRTVGVVTSASGAVWHDIQTVLARRWPMAGLLLAPAAVQGEGAARSIARAIGHLNEVASEFDDVDLDVIIVARGGGSEEDLWAFNEERVARAIFASDVPIVSAVGHETDTTLADFVADVRAPTPSAAAELVAPDAREEAARVHALITRGGRGLSAWREAASLRVIDLGDRLERHAPELERERVHLERVLGEAAALLDQRMARERAVVAGASGRLQALSPVATLDRGYAIVQDTAGAVVRRAADLRRGQRVALRFRDGRAAAEIVNDADAGEDGD